MRIPVAVGLSAVGIVLSSSLSGSHVSPVVCRCSHGTAQTLCPQSTEGHNRGNTEKNTAVSHTAHVPMCSANASNKLTIIYLHFIALFWVLKALYKKGGGGVSSHHQCAASTWMMWRQPYAPERPPHTSYWWRETVIKTISVWGWLGGHDGQRPMGEFCQMPGLHPTLFRRTSWDFEWPQRVRTSV